MGKRTSGLLAAITLVAAGAAALFLSDKNNRKLATVELTKAAKRAKVVGRKIQQSKAAQELEAEATKVARKVIRETKKMAQPATKKVVKKATKTVKRVARKIA